MKNGLALVIGLNTYENLSNLDNAVNDAELIGASLENLGFLIKRGIEKSIGEIDTLIEEFCAELSGFDLGLFYFAGHGFQIDGQNLLAGKEVNITTLSSAERGSIILDRLIDKMDKSGVAAKIIVLDACRKPIDGLMRGSESNTFAPVFAPKGTLIAFSTSPGEGAKDGTGSNSNYTLAFVQHLKQENIEIELFFKRVRATVSAVSQGKQTSWEHTSLIGPLVLNSGQLRHSKDLPYSDKVIADHEFKTVNSGSTIDVQLAALSGNFYKQNDALDEISVMSLGTWSDDQLFLLGRGIVNAGENGSHRGLDIYSNLKNWLIKHGGTKANHIVNGMFYETYFNGYGLFRKSKLKQTCLKELVDLQNDVRFHSSFAMINDQLRPFADRLLYIPGPETLNLPVDLTLDRSKEEDEILKVIAINVHGNNLTNHNIEEDYPSRRVTKDELITLISKELMVPRNRITLNPNLPDNRSISIPFSYPEHRFTIDLFEEKPLKKQLEV